MGESNKLVSMIALVIAGLLVAAWGAIYIWLHRNDSLVIADLQRQGRITVVEASRLTNPTWIWVMAIVQIVIGIALIAWGIIQYFVNVEDVVVVANKGLDTVVRTVRGNDVMLSGNGSRRVFTTTSPDFTTL